MSQIRRAMMRASRHKEQARYVVIEPLYGIQLRYTPTIDTEIEWWGYQPTDIKNNVRIPFTDRAGRTPYNYMYGTASGVTYYFSNNINNNSYGFYRLNNMQIRLIDFRARYFHLYCVYNSTGWRMKKYEDQDELCEFSWDDVNWSEWSNGNITSSDWDSITTNATGTLWFFPDNYQWHIYSIVVREQGVVVFDLKPSIDGTCLINQINGDKYFPKYVSATNQDNILSTE